MAFSQDLKIFWYCPIKTANRSCHAVQNFFGFQSLDHEYLNESQKDFYVISNFRNPYARYVSVYYYLFPDKSKDIQSFRRYVKKRVYEEINMPLSIEPIVFDLCKIYKLVNRFPDRLIKLENFYNDLLQLDFIQKNMSLELENIIKENILKNNFYQDRRPRPEWKEFYNEETADLVYNHLYDNFVLGNYEKDSWKNGTS